MSGKVAGMVWDHYPGDDQGELLTALFLADAADHLGRDVYPSAPRIAFFTRQSERTVRYQLKRMRSIGFLVQEGSGLGGRGKPTRYHIDLQWLKGLPDRSQQWEAQRVQILQSFQNPALTAPIGAVKPCKKGVETLQKPCSLIAGEPQNRGTLKTTTTTSTPDSAGAGGGVHFEELPSSLQDKARLLVDGLLPSLQADVVDELLGQIEEKVAKQPERLLKTLIRAAGVGALTLDHARRCRERRRSREEVALARGAATVLPLDDAAKRKGATLLERIAPSAASRFHSSTAN